MKKFGYLQQRPVMTILVVAILQSLVIAMTAYYVMQMYQIFQPIWVEQAAYSQKPMLEFWAQMQDEGFWQAIMELGNQRHVLQLIVLGAVMPLTLRWFFAPLLIALPMFFVFIAIFGWTLYKRTNHLGYSLSGMLLFLAINQLTRHDWGIGSGFADWQSMFLLSASALSLINALINPGILWVRSFAVFVSLAVLARITSVFYAVVICGPILLLYFVDQYRRERSLKKLGVTLLNVFIFVLPVGVLVLGQLANLLAYYSPGNAAQLRQPLSVSAEIIFLTLLFPFLGMSLVFILIALFVFNFRKITHTDAALYLPEMSTIAIGWWFFGFVGFLLANGYTSDVPKEVMYAVPALFLLCLSPIFESKQGPAPHFKLLSIGLILFSSILFGWNSFQNIEFARVLTPEQSLMRNIQRDLAEQLVSLPAGTIWQSYTSVDWGIPVSLITQYEFGEYRQYGGDDYFYNKKDYWDTWYSGLSLNELQNVLYERTTNCIDAAVILKDPEIQPPDMEDYSYSIASFIASNIKNDLSWEYFATLEGWPDGIKYQIYLNATPGFSRDCKSRESLIIEK